MVSIRILAAVLVVSGAMAAPRAVAGPLDGLAGAAVGFALGAMVAGPRHRSYAYRSPRAAYRRPVARARYAAAPSRRAVARAGGPARMGGAPISTASDPFAGAASAKPVPVSGN